MRILDMTMIKPFLLSCLIFICDKSNAGMGTGQVTDIYVQQGLAVVHVQNTTGQPGCVNWYHNYGIILDGSDSSKILYTMLVTARSTGSLVRIVGVNSCISNTGSELIHDINLGGWYN